MAADLRSGALALAALGLALGLGLALPGAPPPQSRPVHAAQVVLMKGPEVLPGSDALAQAFPEVASLAPEQRTAVARALGLTDAPCVPCLGRVNRPISSCALDTPRGCENLPGLVRRAAHTAATGADWKGIQASVLYGDAWVPDAAAEASAGAVPVELWVDPGSPGLAEVLGVLDGLQRVDLRLHLMLRRPDAPWAALALGAESDGRLLDLLRCWAGASGDDLSAASCPGLPLDDWRAKGASQRGKGEQRRAEMVAARGLRSSPSWFVAGYRMRGLQSIEALQRAVDRELASEEGEL